MLVSINGNEIIRDKHDREMYKGQMIFSVCPLAQVISSVIYNYCFYKYKMLSL